MLFPINTFLMCHYQRPHSQKHNINPNGSFNLIHGIDIAHVIKKNYLNHKIEATSLYAKISKGTVCHSSMKGSIQLSSYATVNIKPEPAG